MPSQTNPALRYTKDQRTCLKEEAKASKNTHFISSVPCMTCHGILRYKTSRSCIYCAKEQVKLRRIAKAEEAQAA